MQHCFNIGLTLYNLTTSYQPEDNVEIVKYLNFSLEKDSLRSLIQECHKSFYLTVFVGA